MAYPPLPVTVVIPAYRRPDLVERAVRSVLDQRRPAAEVIVIDDASGDDTGARAAELGARVIAHDENRGEGAARNTGLEAAAHEWVALLDCDDEWLPDHLETVWPARDGHVLVGTAMLAAGHDPDDHRVYGWAGPGPRVLSGPEAIAVPENKLAASSVLLRRDAALAVGGFRPLPRAADLDMWVRLLERGSAMALPRVTVLYHQHAGQASADSRLMHAAHKAVLDSHSDRPWCTRALLLRHEGILAWDAARTEPADGDPPALTAAGLARRLVHPQRAIGVAQLLAGRFRRRRLAARFAAGGVPSVAIMPGAGVEPGGVAGAVDLRGRSFAGALAHLVRRPTARAVVRGRAGALALQALGIEPVRPRGGRLEEPA
ncbi:MAG TPA: glycosyltransferase family 2 protein [Thermoleophilaceae bacterium]|jgi:GT2 family glycosyltransferase